MAPAADMAARPPRMPKLTYRNRLPDDQSSLSSQTTQDTLTTSTYSCSSDTLADQQNSRPTTASTTEMPTRPSSDSRSTSSGASTSLASSNGSTSRESKASSKKKKNGVLGFLTLKEPSQLALEQFAESQRKQAAAKGGTVNPVGLQGISPQKLPANVPKVNSKWDGVPESVKSSRNSIMSSKRDSSSSHGSQPAPSYSYSINTSAFSVASDGSRGPPNSLASPMNSSIHVSQRRDSGASETPSLDSPSTPSLPEFVRYFPDSPNSTEALPPLPPSPAGRHPWSPPPQPTHLSPKAFPFPDSGSDDQTIIADLAEHNLSVDSRADAIFRKLKGDEGFLASEAHEFNFEEDPEDPDFAPGSHDFLFVQPPLPAEPHAIGSTQNQNYVRPPVDRSPRISTTNFSRPRPSLLPLHSHKDSLTSTLPTLYEVSIASTETITELSDMQKDQRRDSDEYSIAPSIAASVTPSEMSASWYRSPRERLGLGGRLRKNDVLPWESQEELSSKPKKGRLSVFSKASG